MTAAWSGGLEGVEHVAIGDKGDRPEEMPGQADIFLHLLEMAGDDRRELNLFAVDAAVLEHR